jgi:hypothetical protein
MGIAIVIATVTRNDRVLTESIGIDLALGGRSTARFRTKHASWFPAVGQPVEIYHQDETTLMFRGTIDEVSRFYPEDFQGAGYVFSECSCVDLSARLDQRLAGEYEFTDTAAGTIITTLTTDAVLTAEGLDFSLVATGPTLSRFGVTYATFREMLDAITELCPGYRWSVRPDGKVVFSLTSAYSAPFTLTASKAHSISVRETREDYFNQVVVRVTNALRETETQEFTGDGTAQTFELDYPAGRVSKIRVNDVEQDIGIGDVDTGKDWYWNAGSATIRQESGDTPLSGSQVLSVDYQGVEAIYVGASDATEQAARATLENNTGKYEVYREASEFVTRADAAELAQALVDANADMPEVVRYRTSDFKESTAKSLQPGQLQTITVSGLGLSGSWLVRTVSISAWRVDDQAEYQWWYDVEAIQGPSVADYVQFFRGLGGGSGGGGGLGSTAVASQATGIHFLGSGNSLTLQLENGFFQEVLLDRATTTIADATFNGSAPTPGTQFGIIFTADSTAGRNVSWGAKFVGTGAIALDGEAGAINIFEFVTLRNGNFLRRNTPAIGVD